MTAAPDSRDDPAAFTTQERGPFLIGFDPDGPRLNKLYEVGDPVLPRWAQSDGDGSET